MSKTQPVRPRGIVLTDGPGSPRVVQSVLSCSITVSLGCVEVRVFGDD